MKPTVSNSWPYLTATTIHAAICQKHVYEGLSGKLITSILRPGKRPTGKQVVAILKRIVKRIRASWPDKTLLDIPLMLTDKNYRQKLLTTITDTDLLNFWQNVFPKFSLHALIPILDKLTVFTDSDIIKPIISQPKSDIDFSDIINHQKIFIANLSKGTLGEKNAHILGSFILSGFQMAILGRANIPKPQRQFFSLIIDEFHSYADSTNVDSINSLLSEARKYRVSLITATQFLAQVDRRIKDAILGNVGTLICLRVGIDDAQVLQKELGQFTAEDLLNLNVGQAIVRMGTAQDSFNLQIPLLDKPENDYKQEILGLAQQKRTIIVSESPLPPQTIASKTTSAPPITSITPLQSSSMLSKEENGLLMFIYQKNTPLPFTKLAKEINISTRQLYKLVGTLSKKSLITETQINLAAKTRKSRVIILTADGIAALGYPQPAGKGGTAHQYFQRLIKDFAQKQGYTVKIEKHLGSQKAVDLSLEKGREKVAVEISITTDAANEFTNIQKCLAAQYDPIFVLCYKQRTMEHLKKLVDQHYRLPERAKINISLLQHLFRLSFRTT